MEQRSIGDFGVARESTVELTFGYFDHELRVHPDAGELSYLDFMAQAQALDEEDEADGIRLTMDFLHDQIHPDDWLVFFDLAKKNRQTLEDLMLLSKAIVEATAGFPTGQPADSSPTPPSTGPKSKAASSGPGRPRAPRKPRAITAKVSKSDVNTAAAMEQLRQEGRPDLMRFVELAQVDPNGAVL